MTPTASLGSHREGQRSRRARSTSRSPTAVSTRGHPQCPASAGCPPHGLGRSCSLPATGQVACAVDLGADVLGEFRLPEPPVQTHDGGVRIAALAGQSATLAGWAERFAVNV